MSARKCFDGRNCREQAPVPDSATPDDDLEYPIEITGTVVQFGNSDPADVRIIQQALNRVSPSLGGPQPKLKVDGICGPNTHEAIGVFQKRQTQFVDFKVDPGKATINKLNEAELGLFVSVSPRIIKRLYEAVLPEVQACIVAADAALLSASSSFSGSPNVFGSASVALVNRHFKLDQSDQPFQRFNMIQALFRDMSTLVRRNLSGVEQTYIAAPGRFLQTRVERSGVLAEAFSNGVAATGKLHGRAQDGSDVEVEANKILIHIPFGRTTIDGQIMTLIHEMGHFLGGPDASPTSIDDPPSRSSSADEIAKLPARRMPFIAQNYATFAFEARFRRPPFVILI